MLQHRSMLTNLTISQWTARKHDKKVTAEVDSTHGAKDAGRFNKLLVDKAALEPINKVASAARLHLYKVTLPWGDNGDRLLPSNLFLSFSQDIQLFKSQFQAAVDKFVRDYPQLQADARQRLGTLYDPKDYPLASDIASRFGMNLDIAPVPDAKDFRVDVDKEQVEMIRKQITRSVEARQQQAMADCWHRVREVLERYVDRLGDEKAIFRDSLVENCETLLGLLPALNITNDPALDAIAYDMKQLIHAPDALRADTHLRAATAAHAAELLGKLPA